MHGRFGVPVPVATLTDPAFLRGVQPGRRSGRPTDGQTGDAMYALGTTRTLTRALAALAGATALASVVAAAG
jgi:hypothetical protein